MLNPLSLSNQLYSHTRPETKEGQQRPINRTYYYIDYRATIDAIKWRVYLIDKEVQGNTVPADERKEYSCPRCKSEWTQMDVLETWSPSGFLCHKCRNPLVRNDESNRGGHEQSSKLNAQFRFITDLLPKIDQVVIPDNNFEVALAAARPVIRDPLLNPASATVPTDAAASRPTAVKGLQNTGPTSISVTVTASDGPTAAERAAEQARKDAYATQNAMPAHFTHSTVTGEQVIMTDPTSNAKIGSADESKDKKDALATTPMLSGEGETSISDSYFEQLKAEQAREAAQEREEEFETDEDDEDEFEDVMPNGGVGVSSGVGTPASSASAPLPSALKKGGTPSSGTSTGVPSPATGPQTPESGRAAKKVRIEEPTVTVKAEEESEEDDVEFEDV